MGQKSEAEGRSGVVPNGEPEPEPEPETEPEPEMELEREADAEAEVAGGAGEGWLGGGLRQGPCGSHEKGVGERK